MVTYSLIGDGVALSLFSVNPGSGAISTRTTLSSDNREQYVVSSFLCLSIPRCIDVYLHVICPFFQNIDDVGVTINITFV